MSFLKPREVVLHYRLRPGAPGQLAVVFANSLGTDMRIWDDVIAWLPEDWPILTYDKRGHGLSGDGDIDLDLLADDVADLMDAHGIPNALICGVSVGGMIAQTLAARRPDLVAGLVLCMTAHRMGEPEGWSQRIDAITKVGIEGIADGIIERWFSDAYRRENPVDLAGYRTMLTRSPRDGYLKTCAMIRDADLTPVSKSLSCPTLCLAGSEDQAAEPKRVRELADLIPDATYRCLDGIGHLQSIEAPDR